MTMTWFHCKSSPLFRTLVCGFLASFLVRYDWDLVFYVSGLIGLLWALTGKTCLMSAPSYRSSRIEANNNAASLSLKAFFNSSVAYVTEKKFFTN